MPGRLFLSFRWTRRGVVAESNAGLSTIRVGKTLPCAPLRAGLGAWCASLQEGWQALAAFHLMKTSRFLRSLYYYRAIYSRPFCLVPLALE
jgi:hypothetical protein